MALNYLVFGLILFYIPMRIQINLFLSSLGKKKKPVTLLRNVGISKILSTKAKTKIDTIKIIESDLPFGMMVGIPGNPQLILSRKLYETFDKDELEYVILHEAGHYKLSHSVKELTEGIIFFAIGLFVLVRFPSIILAAILGLVFGILMIQLAKISELEADNFSLKRMRNPKGMITATEKFYKVWKSQDPKIPLIRYLFYRGNPYENRIKMATVDIKRRFKIVK